MQDNTLTLYRKQDQVFLKRKGKEDTPVSVVWLRPATEGAEEISLITGQEEACLLSSLEQLDPQSRSIAREELEKNYFYVEIQCLIRTDVNLGNRYFEADTDRGRTKFVVKNPYVDIRPAGKDGVIIRDSVGNLYRIKSLSMLDARSRKELEKVI